MSKREKNSLSIPRGCFRSLFIISFRSVLLFASLVGFELHREREENYKQQQELKALFSRPVAPPLPLSFGVFLLFDLIKIIVGAACSFALCSKQITLDWLGKDDDERRSTTKQFSFLLASPNSLVSIRIFSLLYYKIKRKGRDDGIAGIPFSFESFSASMS
jgi:hypothetical protein